MLLTGSQEMVISQDQDPFFAKNMYLNFGDLGQNAKDYVEQFASKQASGQKLDSIEDMKRFVEEYPEFRRLSGNVTKHVTLVGELSRRVGAENLLEVSEVEQSLACNDNHASDLKVRSPFPHICHILNKIRMFKDSSSLRPSLLTLSCVLLHST